MNSLVSLLDDLHRNQLLEPAKLDQLSARRLPDGKALSAELVRRGWFTPYQASKLLNGQAADLVQGQYLVLDRLGEGGMGQVFKARHRGLKRLVALKVIRQDFVGDAETVARFYREIQVTSRLTHPNVIRADDAGPLGATHFLAMEYVEGTDLDRLIKQSGPLNVVRACDCVRQAALGLQAVHELELVHRDIKPSNLLATKAGGVVKILDLGLARLQESVHGKSTTRLPDGQSLTTLTLDGPATLGSVDYLSPEQALDFHRVDIRSDIYSLGCTFFFLLTGKPPFGGGPLAVKLMRHQQAEPPELERFRSDIPPGLTPILRRMMAKRPADRYQTPAEVAAALAPFTGFAPTAALLPDRRPLAAVLARRGRGAILLSLLLLLLGVGWMMSRGPSAGTPTGLRISTGPMRNAALRDLGDNSWLRIGPFQGGDKDFLEATWCYDPDRSRFVRIGGRQTRHSNAVSSFDLGTGSWTLILPFAADPADASKGLTTRPAYGSERGICYDRDLHCCWDYCGSQFGGRSGLWQGKGDLGAGDWVYVEEVKPTGHCRVAYDEHAKKVVCLGLDMGSWGHTYVYDPATRRSTEAAPEPTGKAGRAGLGQFPGFVYVPELKGCLFIARSSDRLRKEGSSEMLTWLFDAASGKWHDLAPRGPGPSGRVGMGVSHDRKHGVVLLFGGGREAPTPEILDDLWVYDPAKNTWTEIKSATGPKSHYQTRPTGNADCQLLAYDEEHNVHVLVLQNWADKDSAVWAYRYKK